MVILIGAKHLEHSCIDDQKCVKGVYELSTNDRKKD